MSEPKRFPRVYFAIGAVALAITGTVATAAESTKNAATAQSTAQTVFELPPGLVLAESIARDDARHRWLVGEVHGRAIVQVDDAGKSKPYFTVDAPDLGVYNLAVDAARKRVWASVSPAPTAFGRDVAPMLVEIDLVSGRERHRYVVPQAKRSSLGDMALSRDGTVYVSDSGAGRIFRLRDNAKALEEVLPAGKLESPQGLFPTPDGARLIVSDYATGFHSIDLATHSVELIATPPERESRGIDGVVTCGQDAIVVQNGTREQRVLAMRFDPTFHRVERVDTLVAGPESVVEPTGGEIVDGAFVFVARSQWDAFSDKGEVVKPDAPAVRIARLHLPAGVCASR